MRQFVKKRGVILRRAVERVDRRNSYGVSSRPIPCSIAGRDPRRIRHCLDYCIAFGDGIEGRASTEVRQTLALQNVKNGVVTKKNRLAVLRFACLVLFR